MTRAVEEDAFAEGTIARHLVRIAVPLMLSAGVHYGVELSNAYWVGKLGVTALSAVTALGTFMSLSRMFGGLTSAGTSAVVARLIGEGRRPDALRAAQKVTAVALVLGLVVSALGLAVSRWALDALSFEGAARDEAADYLFVLLAGLPFSFGMMAMNGVLVGLGKPRSSVFVSVVSLGVGFIVTPLLLRGLGAGVWGAAVGEISGHASGYLVGTFALARHVGRDHALEWRDRFRELRELWPVVRVGTPLTADAVLRCAVWFGLMAFLSGYGHEYVAAQGAEEHLTQVLNLPTEGIAPAAATLVGYYLGKDRRQDAMRVVWLALGVVSAIALAGAALMRLVPAPVLGWLCADPSFVHVGSQVLAIAAIGMVFLSGRDVLEGSFGGVGNTVPPVIIGVFIAVSRFPLAYLFAVELRQGGLGVAIAVNLTLAVQTLVLLGWFFLRFDRLNVRPTAPRGVSIASSPQCEPVRGAS